MTGKHSNCWKKIESLERQLKELEKDKHGADELRKEFDGLLKLSQSLQSKLKESKGCDHLDKPYRELVERNRVLESAVKLGIAGLCRQLKEDSLTVVKEMEAALSQSKGGE